MRLTLSLTLAAAAAAFRAPSRVSPPRPTATRRNMFSGIVEEVGEVKSMQENKAMTLWDGSVGKGWELEVVSGTAVQGAELGCSIAINGVCLTATEIEEDAGRVKFGVAPETLRLTNLGALAGGAKVNVERALPTESRNSGHFVQGHVDDRGLVVKSWREGDSLWLKIAVPGHLMRYIVPKGFVAVDGTSLTVCETAPAALALDRRARDEPDAGDGAVTRDIPEGYGWFTLMLVAYTQSKIILPEKALVAEADAAAEVNIEVDVLAKYVERGLQGVLDRMEQLEAQVAALTPKE
uniref:Lumazine-binding domain-containing protein n=1 Tax=Phaeomonas parva TaxID=124430 RepID=A0A7S1TQH2_9STRA|mmetsp:Transcript_12374/g.37155  ORF Transcript_12374/g.37155 Transcript_12374/m.37155 type:complete len:294 (+) Transcript_12374:107-988(+)|eukprot:CAMPEP_0118863212 /NCGR_PEP_ID=MMETSP1163-20130328/8165_1 /TAXON_ID=124430 /ORGANISM="Phaeomonas parva, Strain CCMP2877" /LENGTH=293 /DNA_ID=CAMNT_0006797197 /DNA_START=68 /DNA_END=949 /DNA_ORIENTATION=-